jgi:hypothetical protein
MSEEDKASLRKRLDTADRVMDRITKAHSGGTGSGTAGINGGSHGTADHGGLNDQLTYEEYRDILNALTDLNVVPDKAQHPELIQAMRELPNMQAAMQRRRADSYHTLMVGSAGMAVSRQQEQRRAKREKFDAIFENQLDKKQAGGKDYIADLPEHCVKETAAEKVVVFSGIVIILVQLASAYISLSLSFRLPSKAE